MAKDSVKFNGQVDIQLHPDPLKTEPPAVKVNDKAEQEKIKTPEGSGGSDGHETCTAAGQINYLTDGLFDLRARLSKLEVAVLSLENQAGSPGAVARDGAKNALLQINNVAKQIEVLTEGLRTTPDYNLGKTFNCTSCNATGTIAIKVRCTACGKENWWGYWPKKGTVEK